MRVQHLLLFSCGNWPWRNPERSSCEEARSPGRGRPGQQVDAALFWCRLLAQLLYSVASPTTSCQHWRATGLVEAVQQPWLFALAKQGGRAVLLVHLAFPLPLLEQGRLHLRSVAACLQQPLSPCFCSLHVVDVASSHRAYTLTGWAKL